LIANVDEIADRRAVVQRSPVYPAASGLRIDVYSAPAVLREQRLDNVSAETLD
jgi:hypothetical protein